MSWTGHQKRATCCARQLGLQRLRERESLAGDLDHEGHPTGTSTSHYFAPISRCMQVRVSTQLVFLLTLEGGGSLNNKVWPRGSIVCHQRHW